MKKILQALDNTASKPVEGASDMSKFMQIVNEGANPHKVALPVQMAMQHYQEPAKKVIKKESLLKKYFAEAEEQSVAEIEEERAIKEQRLKMYSQQIAERVLNKNKKLAELDKSTLGNYVQANAADQVQRASSASFKSGAAGDKYNKSDDTHKEKMRQKGLERAVKKLTKESIEDQPDAITVDVPLLIRLLEYAREDAKTDIDLHNVAENMINLGSSGKTLSMDDYNKIIPSNDIDQSLPEDSDPCWKGYKQIGMKKKGGKQVPNCVPKK